MRIIDQNEAETVGLAQANLNLGEQFASTQCFDIEYLRQFVERCDEMGWETVDVYIADGFDFPLVAHEHNDDQGVYVMATPITPDEDEEDDR